MAGRESRSVSLTPQHASFVDACVASGRYQSASEVVRASLRLLQDQEDEREATLARARQMIAEGAAQMDRGELVDADAVFKRLEEEHRRLSESEGRRAG